MAELGPAAVPFSLSPADELRPVLQTEMYKLHRQGQSYSFRNNVKLKSASNRTAAQQELLTIQYSLLIIASSFLPLSVLVLKSKLVLQLVSFVP
jgi:hypothetical protein